MEKFTDFMKGYRTYIMAAAGAIVQGCVFAGVLEQDTANKLFGLLGFGAVASLRAAVK